MPKNILIIEDEFLIAEDIREKLENLGYKTVGTAASYREALIILKRHRVDLVLMDIGIKGDVNGIRASNKIYAAFDIPTVFLTSYRDNETLDKAIESAAFGYLMKPADDQSMRAAVEIAIYKHRITRDLRISRERMNRLNRILRAARDISKLSAKNENPNLLIRESCELMIKSKGYLYAWIAVVDESGLVKDTACVGCEKEFEKIAEGLKKDIIPPCLFNLEPEDNITIIDDPVQSCGTCPLAGCGPDRGVLISRLQYKQRLYGYLVASVSRAYLSETDEQNLFLGMAEDIAYSLYRIDLEEERGRILAEIEIKSELVKLSEENLKKEKGLTDALLNNMNDTLFVFDVISKKPIRWNKTFVEVSGYSDEEIASMKAPDDFYDEEDLKKAADAFQQIMSEGKSTLEMQLITKSGNRLVTEYSGSFLHDEENRPRYLISIGRNIEKRRAVEEALRESNLLLNQIASAIDDCFWMMDWIDHKALFANPAYEKIWGRTVEELYDNPMNWADAIHKDDKKRVERAYADIVKNDGIDQEYRIHRPDGSIRWVRDRGYPIYDSSGRAYRVAGVAQDITEEKKAGDRIRRNLKEKEAMLKEIHHRVKNNLQIIISLLNLQSQKIDASVLEEALEESKNRIYSIALVHERLYKSEDFSSINFKAYLLSLAEELRSAYSVEGFVDFSFHIQDVSLDIARAIPCGLIVNELLTNALKHAFKPGEKGTVSVSFRKTKAGVHILSVQDNGAGIPDDVGIDSPHTLGLQLVNTLVTQIDGKLALQSDGKTRFEIKF